MSKWSKSEPRCRWGRCFSASPALPKDLAAETWIDLIPLFFNNDIVTSQAATSSSIFEIEGEFKVEAKIEEPQDWRLLKLRRKTGSRGSAVLRFNAGNIPKPFWCMPSIFWGDNLQDDGPALYPRFDPEAIHPEQFRSRRWLIPVNRLSQPIVAVYSGSDWFILETSPYAIDCNGEKLAISLGFEWSAKSAVLLLRVPEAEEPYAHTGCEFTQANRRFIEPSEGDSFQIHFRWTKLHDSKIKILEILREGYERCASEHRFHVEKLPRDFALAAVDGILNWHYSPENHTFKYTVVFDRIAQQIAESSGCTLDSPQFFIGWANGWLVLEALLDYTGIGGSPNARQAVINTWSCLQERITAPCGLWWSRYAPVFRARSGQTLRSCFDSRIAGEFDGGWMADPHHLHLRTLGDGILRAARSLRKHGSSLPFSSSLRASIVQQARQIASMVGSDGAIPLAVDARSGRPTEQTGSASMIWIQVWLELKRQECWHDDLVIEQATSAARKAVQSGALYGAPEDVGECASSEDVYIAINTFCALYATFKRDEDLQTAVAAANFLFLYRRCFHVPLPRGSLLGAYELSGFGADFASPKNNHLHVYGLDVEFSLIRLTEWTGDPIWRQLADDHWAYSTQTICMEDGYLNGYRGLTPEQLYFTNWACLGNSVHHQEEDTPKSAWVTDPNYVNRGNIAGFSNIWCAALILRSALRRAQSLDV